MPYIVKVVLYILCIIALLTVFGIVPTEASIKYILTTAIFAIAFKHWNENEKELRR
jgi:hypothetical protein